MLIYRNKLYPITLCCCISVIVLNVSLVCAITVPDTSIDDTNSNGLQQHATVRNFSPRLDYNNEWRPVGRGDPLKNDPTYDYSPPALDRVRYWADSSDNTNNKDAGQRKPIAEDHTSGGDLTARKGIAGKNEIHMLGAANERIRNAGIPHQHTIKNTKGDVPLLQPKYPSIRRSYYSHQLPTRLMPPPMQSISPSHMLKPAQNGLQPQNEYRHNMLPGSGYMSSSTIGMATHSKPYYSTAATSPWTHTSSTHMHHRTPMTYDSHLQESAHYISYSQPSTSSGIIESYIPNSVHNQNMVKSNHMQRKPWLHELLQKEVVKTVKPTYSPMKYMMEPTKHTYASMPSISTSTAYAPISFVTPTPSSHSLSYTTSPIYITTTLEPTSTASIRSYSTSTMPSTSTSRRLLIPNSNNLEYRPTVVPMKTKDPLFKHYNQPEEPLLGPMYLIIEGHSKVKTYGQGELDPHQPKIVPIIPKREPVVRLADPHEKRGTIETFQVKHLHTKTTATTAMPPQMPNTTPALTSSNSSVAPATNTSTTTEQPSIATDNPSNNKQPSVIEDLLTLLESSLTNYNSNSTKGNFTSEKVEVATTEPAPREVRQVFDYDNLSNSRLKQMSDNSSEIDEMVDDSWLTKENYDDIDDEGSEDDDDDDEDEDVEEEYAHENQFQALQDLGFEDDYNSENTVEAKGNIT